MNAARCVGWGWVAWVAMGAVPPAGAQPWLRWVPEQSNAVAVVDMQRLLDSPLADSRQWKDELIQQHQQGRLATPPSTLWLLRATQWRPDAEPLVGSPAAIGLYLLPNDVNLRSLARRENGPIGKVADRFVVLSARESFFVRLQPRLLGRLDGADSRTLSQWILGVDERPYGNLDPYVGRALADGARAEIVLAANLADRLPPGRVRGWLANQPPSDQPLDPEVLAGLFEALLGARVAVEVGQRAEATVVLDFAAQLPPEAQRLREPILRLIGGFAPDMHQVRYAVDGEAIVVQAVVGERTLRRLLTLVDAPDPLKRLRSPSETFSPTPPSGIGSRQYDAQAVSMLRDLFRRTQVVRRFHAAARDCEQVAGRIDELPTLGVDPELLDFGARTASRLRSMAAMLRGVPVELARLQRTITYEYLPTYGAFNLTTLGPIYYPTYVEVRSNVTQVRTQQAEALRQASRRRDEMWDEIVAQRQDIARKMEIRYETEFDTPIIR